MNCQTFPAISEIADLLGQNSINGDYRLLAIRGWKENFSDGRPMMVVGQVCFLSLDVAVTERDLLFYELSRYFKEKYAFLN